MIGVHCVTIITLTYIAYPIREHLEFEKKFGEESSFDDRVIFAMLQQQETACMNNVYGIAVSLFSQNALDMSNNDDSSKNCLPM